MLDESPSVVALTFDEVVRVPANGVRAYDASGRALRTQVRAHDSLVSVTMPPQLPRGSYVVSWRVISLDGHTVVGSISFSVGAPSVAATLPSGSRGTDSTLANLIAVANGLNYLGLLVAGGLSLFVRWIVRGVHLDRSRARRLTSTAWIATGLSIVTAALLVTARGAERLGQGPGGLGRPATLDLHLGASDLIVLVLQASALPASLRLRSSWASTGAVVVALFSPAWVGHSRTTTPEWLGVASDLAHLIAGATWLGGLVGLALLLPALRNRPHDSATLLTRFSTTGAIVLAVLLGTGVFAAWRILGSWSALVHTTYGRLLLVKVGIVALAVVLAGINKVVLLPRVRVTDGEGALASAMRLMSTLVRGEACLLVGVLALTGFLTEHSPNEVPAAQSGVAPRAEASINNETVQATIRPGRVGLNTLTVEVRGRAGDPTRMLASPTVEASNGPIYLGPIEVDRVEPGTYSAQVILARAGTWKIQVGLRISQFDNPVTTLPVPIH